jgi:hypothetical protein
VLRALAEPPAKVTAFIVVANRSWIAALPPGVFLRFASREFRWAWPVAGVGFTIRPSADRFVESDRLPAIDLPVANAVNENGMNVQRVAAAFNTNG